MANLVDVVEINPRIDRNAGVEASEQVAFVPMASVSEISGSIVTEQFRLYSEVAKGFTPFQDRDVIVAKITPCFENGKIAHARISKRLAFGSTEFHVLRARESSLDDRYLFHFLRQPSIRERGEKRMTGSGGQRRVPRQFLEELQIPLPSIAEQRRIATILDKADAIRAKRREAIAKLDQLLQSVFLDMFGDPVTNPKGWPKGTIRDLVDTANYGTSAKADTAGDVPVLRMNNLTYSGEMDLTDLKYVPNTVAESKFLVREGDLLFNRTNSRELVGKTAVYVGPEPMTYAGYLVRVRANSAGTSEYLSGFLNSNAGKTTLRNMCKSIVGMANINAQELQNIGIAIPPIELQRDFSQKVQAIRSQKTKLQRHQISLDSLFSSLQSGLFRDLK